MRAVAGTVLLDGQWREGFVLVERGRVVAVEPGKPPVEPSASGTVVPAFVDAHTHLGDLVARGRPLPASLAEAVRPPDGFKHRVLRATPRAELVAGMRRGLAEVDAGHAWAALDFREGGLDGVRQLREAARGQAAEARALARPDGPELAAADARRLAREADGLAISSLPDVGEGPARALRAAAREAGKPFALHASEAEREPLDPVLGLEPSLLVHLTHAPRGDLERVADAGIAVAVCPRSNWRWLRRLPDLGSMLDLGIPVALGTDNAMLGPCDVLAEARALREMRPQLAAMDALRMLTEHGWRALGLRALAPGSPAELLVFPSRHARPEQDVLAAGAVPVHRERSAA
jgi:cytosine/adenosine deaminase-related metal-dependent hydrolase